MNESTDSGDGFASSTGDDGGLNRRVFRAMLLSVLLAAGGSAVFAPWRVSTGLLAGGLLSLLNHHWMRSSVAAVFDARLAGRELSGKVSGYILRYFLIAAIVVVVYALDVVSLRATIAGLCSFVVALFAEALREGYLAIVHREEIS